MNNSGSNSNSNSGSSNSGNNSGSNSNKNATARQRGGARRRRSGRKTMRIPGVKNVLRVTGKTARKVRNAGVYGIKKVGNGVHVLTGLVSRGLSAVTRVVRRKGRKGKTAKRRD